MIMNRAERRKLGIKQKEPIVNIKRSDIEQIKKDVTKETIDTAFLLMLGIPTMIIHDKFAQLIKKNVDGKNREERFVDLCLELYDCFEQGYVTLDDLKNCLKEEAGVEFKK